MPTLPTGPTWHFEIKVDGHRTILRRTGDGVICYFRTGRTVTSYWMDLAVPAMALPPGTVLDGEAVIWNGGTIDFGAVQARAASLLDRARALAARRCTERRTVLADVGPPLQPVLAADDRSTALHWYETLQPRESRHRRQTCRQSVPVRRPDRVAQDPPRGHHGRAGGRLGRAPPPPRTPPGRERLALSVGVPGSGPGRRLGALLADAPATGVHRTETGETYTAPDTELAVEVLAGTGRHGTVTGVRIR
ncbi:hypothetical protein ACFV1G_15320 [Streptomyces anulatus]|uniref:ATP-dependent DNA ligase n=1 Tax=Streptomyces anulatus TaxID=1892 RepID=UPI003680A577